MGKSTDYVTLKDNCGCHPNQDPKRSAVLKKKTIGQEGKFEKSLGILQYSEVFL